MTSRRPYKHDYSVVRTVSGINIVLWRWARARVAVENRPVGEFFNELIEAYRLQVAENDVPLEFTSPHQPDFSKQRSCRGISTRFWRWLRARSILEGCYLGSLLNELLYRHMVTAGEPARVIGSFLLTCVICGETFETERRENQACPKSRCRVALHRARKSGRYPQ